MSWQTRWSNSALPERNQQLDIIQSQIQTNLDEIEKLQNQLGELTNARQITDTQTQISAQQSKLAALRANYADLLANTSQGALNTLTIIESAKVPSIPIGSDKLIIIGLSAAIALAMASIGAYVYEAMDDTIKPNDDIQRYIQSPILGTIGNIPGKNNLDYVAEAPSSLVSDNFRLLRTNLEFLGIDHPLKSLLITSSGPGEGKSTIASNLALSLAQTEKKVIIVDADFRNPTIHHVVEVENPKGLSDVIRGTIGVREALLPWGPNRVDILPAGSQPPNPTELLGSTKMREILDCLNEIADIVIIDGPPLVIADSLVLSSKVDGLLLVMQLGLTKKKSLQTAIRLVTQSGAKILGIVWNRVPGQPYYNYYNNVSK
jgi:capsular exopolysaccharide synthesis family protein